MFCLLQALVTQSCSRNELPELFQVLSASQVLLLARLDYSHCVLCVLGWNELISCFNSWKCMMCVTTKIDAQPWGAPYKTGASFLRWALRNCTMPATQKGSSRLNQYLQGKDQLTSLSWLESYSGQSWTIVCKINGVACGEGKSTYKHIAKDDAADQAWEALNKGWKCLFKFYVHYAFQKFGDKCFSNAETDPRVILFSTYARLSPKLVPLCLSICLCLILVWA